MSAVGGQLVAFLLVRSPSFDFSGSCNNCFIVQLFAAVAAAAIAAGVLLSLKSISRAIFCNTYTISLRPTFFSRLQVV